MLLVVLAMWGAELSLPAQTFEYRTTEALIVDKNGKPLFRTSYPFLLSVSGNPDGRVLGYDAERRMIRVSESNSWWIPCDQVRPTATACGQNKPKTRGIKIPPSAGDASGGSLNAPADRGIPSCPGDPRCPSGVKSD